jgi:hypothetical protein
MALILTAPFGQKDALTPAQRKISSPLRQVIAQPAGTAKSTPLVKIDDKDRVLADVRAAVTPAMRKTVLDLDATIVSESVQYRSIIAWIPLAKLDTLAEQDAVQAIQPAPAASTNR